jgi:hypothetical protein
LPICSAGFTVVRTGRGPQEESIYRRPMGDNARWASRRWRTKSFTPWSRRCFVLRVVRFNMNGVWEGREQGSWRNLNCSFLALLYIRPLPVGANRRGLLTSPPQIWHSRRLGSAEHTRAQLLQRVLSSGEPGTGATFRLSFPRETDSRAAVLI